jgi:hypothetical protein
MDKLATTDQGIAQDHVEDFAIARDASDRDPYLAVACQTDPCSAQTSSVDHRQ